MIWHDGRLLPGDRVDLPWADRTFEHGLGLFETFRTWGGVAAYLDRHHARLLRSAAALGIPIVPASLPDAAAVADLVAAEGRPDALVRLTATGGQPGRHPAMVWMTTAPLPPGPPESGYRVADAGWTVALEDPLARHKSLNYWSKRLAHERAQAEGFDEAIFASADGRAWEGSRTNLFLVSGRDLVTPTTDGPLVPGILRGVILELAAEAGLHVVEADVTADLIATADEAFLTNSVRGIIPIGSWTGRHEPSPGSDFPIARHLTTLCHEHATRQARPS